MFYFNGYGENALTFSVDLESTKKGTPIKIDTFNVAKSVSDGEDFIGVCKGVDSIKATVIMDGYVEVPYTGTEPTLNYCGLVGNATGGVKVSATAKRNYKVIKVDKEKHIVGFIL